MKHISVTLALLLSVCSLLKAQADSTLIKLDSFVKGAIAFNQVVPQERVYLHFDNTGYYLGENIWYKAYVTTAEDNQPTDLSRVLYVELLTPDGFIAETKKLKIENGQAHGDFHIVDTLYSGFYEIRAYTRYMLNFDQNAVFSRVFPVYSQPEYEGDYKDKSMREREKQDIIKLKEVDAKKALPIKIAFYPEGGNLVKGLSSKVAFKAIDDKGQNINVKGQVYAENNLNEVITSFESSYLGMGSFEFTPDGSKYVANVFYNDEFYKIPIPEDVGYGYVMTTNSMHNSNILIQVQKSPKETFPQPQETSNKKKGANVLPIASDTIGLIISCRGKINYFQVVSVQDEPSTLRIPKADMPTGVNQITLFDENGTILSERLVFINHQEYATNKLTAKTDKETYKGFEPITVNFDVSDTEGNPVESNFSLAIRDTGTEELTYNSDNILTNQLLSSDLKGFIENPAYYFDGNDNTRRYNLDLLMMIQGWRKYNLRQMAGKEPFEAKHKVENEIAFSGTVYSSLDKWGDRKIMKDIQIKAWGMNDSLSMSGLTLADENGQFKFSIGDVTGEFFLAIQTNEMQKKGKNAGRWLKKASNVLLDRFNPPTPKTYTFYETTIPASEQKSKDFKNTSDSISGIKGQHLSEVTVTAKKKKRKRIESLPPAAVIDVADEMDYQIDLFGWKQDGCLDHRSMNAHLTGVLSFDYEDDPYLQAVLQDTSMYNINEIQGMDKEEVYRYLESRNRGKRSAADNIATAARDFQKMGLDTQAADAMVFATAVRNMNKPADPCVETFAHKISHRIELPSATKIQYIYVKPQGTINMFYLDYIEKIEIFTDRNLRDKKEYEKPHEKWISDLAFKYIPYKDNHQRPRMSGLRTTKLHGYSEVQEFYNPDYSNGILPEEPDFRRTLYWNPNVSTDSEGKASVRFYNNSTSKQITISAEGLTKDGKPIVNQ